MVENNVELREFLRKNPVFWSTPDNPDAIFAEFDKAKYIVTETYKSLDMKPFEKLVIKVLRTCENPIKDFNPFDF